MKNVFCATALLLGLSVMFISCEKSGTENRKDDEGGADASGAVDLGLSVKWASCNLGASKPEEFGDYYAWGETSTKEDYSAKNYKFYMGKDEKGFYKYSKYVISPENGTIDNKTQLDPEDDAARVKLGGKWRMPTEKECQELVDKCIWTLQTRMGVIGLEVKSSVNGNSIFLPITGFREKTKITYQSEAMYLSSTLSTRVSSRSSCIGIWLDDEENEGYLDDNVREDGCPIRPVKGK